ncbi:DUF1109 domain-containing protein [Roseivivax marinus]|uniref:DUF1109 domain-containing protein n=1 Tax=Roseivivax marinus TaxID=1379903 RepID=UPI00273F6CEB|nr:DUF1109 domain-containing protein [Roseivivax marinus]
MDTEELISILAADRRPPVRPRLALRVAGGVIVSLLLVLAVWGLRPGWPGLPQEKVMLAKSLWPLAVAALAALPFLRPEPVERGLLWPVAACGLGLAAVWVFAVAAGGPVVGSTILRCMISVPLLAAPVGAALFSGLRYRVILDPLRAGTAAGLCSGAVGAAIYALHCNEDAASFYLLWYGIGIGFCGLFGGMAGRKLLGV